MLREPRQRTASQYLHLKRYAEQYLQASRMLHGCASHCVFDDILMQGNHSKWPAELRYMRVQPDEGVPSLAQMLRGAPRPLSDRH